MFPSHLTNPTYSPLEKKVLISLLILQNKGIWNGDDWTLLFEQTLTHEQFNTLINQLIEFPPGGEKLKDYYGLSYIAYLYPEWIEKHNHYKTIKNSLDDQVQWVRVTSSNSHSKIQSIIEQVEKDLTSALVSPDLKIREVAKTIIQYQKDEK